MEKHSKELQNRSEDWWQSASDEEREDAFLAVMARLYDGAIVDQKSLSNTLSDIFEFDDHMKVFCTICGFDELYEKMEN
tara:strand:+ start:18006 stop:18242 length:237 start_codon:yes stop_codon:yes gene_type:complete